MSIRRTRVIGASGYECYPTYCSTIILLSRCLGVSELRLSADIVKLGFVVCGVMGQLVHLPILASLKQCQLVALAELRPRLGEVIAKRYEIPRLYQSHLQMAEDREVDAVVVIVGDDLHVPVATDLLKSGKHVLVEKPLAMNVFDGEQLVKVADEHGAILMVNFMRRYDPGVEWAAETINELKVSGELGELVFARSHRFGNDWYCNLGEPITTDESVPSEPKTKPLWLPNDLTNTYRYINNVYSHNIDLLRHFLGEVETIEFARIDRSSNLEQDRSFASGSAAPPSLTAELSAGGLQLTAVLRFTNVSATLTCGARSGDFWDEATVFYFEDGWVSVKTPPPLLRNVPAQIDVCETGRQVMVVRPKSGWEWSFRRAHEHFLSCVINVTQPQTSGRDALENLRVMEEIFAKYVESRTPPRV